MGSQLLMVNLISSITTFYNSAHVQCLHRESQNMFVCGYNREERVLSTKESSFQPQQTLTWPKHSLNVFFHWHITISVWPQGVNGKCHQIRKVVPSHQKRANRFRCVHPSPTLYTSIIIYYPIPCTTSVCDDRFPVYTPFVWFVYRTLQQWVKILRLFPHNRHSHKMTHLKLPSKCSPPLCPYELLMHRDLNRMSNCSFDSHEDKFIFLHS